MLELDHIAVAAGVLQEGVAAVEDALGVSLSGGGEHPLMGTHNRLLGLGDVYLEVISINPEAPALDHPRWFDLDHFTGKPRLTNWICRTDDLKGAIKVSPDGIGQPVALTRGDLRWQMLVPASGQLPFDGAYPALIRWDGAAHPAAILPDAGCRLRRFEIYHPQAAALQQVVENGFTDTRVAIMQSETQHFRAEIETPHGVRVLE